MEYCSTEKKNKKIGRKPEKEMKQDWLYELEFTPVNYIDELTHLYSETRFGLVFSQ